MAKLLNLNLRHIRQQIVKNAQALADGTYDDTVLDILSGGTDNHLMLVDLRGLEVYRVKNFRTDVTRFISHLTRTLYLTTQEAHLLHQA